MEFNAFKKNNHGWHRLINAAKFSIAGLRIIFKYEAAFRQELLLLAILTPFALFVPLSLLFKGYLISTGLVVLIIEALNTGLEYLTDTLFREQHTVAMHIKDIGSAAVMLSLINLAVAWGYAIIALFK